MLPSLWEAIAGTREVDWGVQGEDGKFTFTVEMARCWQWKDELPEEQKKAEELQDEVKKAEARADRFDLSEALLEIGLVITSVTLLTRSRIYWYLGILFSIAGIASALSVLALK